MTPPDSHGLDALETRQADALAMGGPDRIARQHEKGRLTARERIATLLEPDSFDELGLLARSDLPDARDRTPADGKICGYGQIGDRTVAVSADDVTVLAGAGGRIGVGKQMALMAYAQRKGYPMIHLGDAGGARADARRDAVEVGGHVHLGRATGAHAAHTLPPSRESMAAKARRGVGGRAWSGGT